MSERPKVAYVTKYALSDGITVRKVKHTSRGDNYIEAEWPGGINGGITLGPSDWCATPAEALEAAEAMRTRKIASLKKQIVKLEKLTFVVPEAPSA